MALFKIFNNFGNTNKTISDVQTHKAGYCYFDASTNKFYVDTIDDNAAGLRQLNGTFYGICSNNNNNANKTVSIPGFALTIGVSVFIKFVNGNTATPNTLTLNVSNSGAISIKYYDNISLTNNSIQAGMICQFVYDGEYWLWVGYLGVDTNDKVAQTLISTDTDRPLLLSYGEQDIDNNSITNIAYRSNNIYANPSTGTITAINYIGKVNGVTIPNNAKFTDTTYNATNGIALDTTTNTFTNTGVRMISAGTNPGTLSVNINGDTTIISIPGFAQDAQGHSIANYYLTKADGVTNVAWDTTNSKLTKTINGTTSDIVTLAQLKEALGLDSLTMHKLKIGTYEYDGTEDVTIPVYSGAYTVS